MCVLLMYVCVCVCVCVVEAMTDCRRCLMQLMWTDETDIERMSHARDKCHVTCRVKVHTHTKQLHRTKLTSPVQPVCSKKILGLDPARYRLILQAVIPPRYFTKLPVTNCFNFVLNPSGVANWLV